MPVRALLRDEARGRTEDELIRGRQGRPGHRWVRKMSEEKIEIDEWVVAVAGQGLRFLGKLPPLPDGVSAETLRVQGKIALRAEGFFHGPLKLHPVFEIITVAGLAQTGAIVRSQSLTLVDYASEPPPLYVKGVAISFCAEMTEADRKTYAELVKQGLDLSRRTRAQKSGLALPGIG